MPSRATPPETASPAPPMPAAEAPSSPAAPPPSAPPPPAAVQAPSPGTTGTPDWETLIDRAGLQGPLRELAVNASLQGIEDQQVTLALPASHAGLMVEPMAGQLQEKIGMALGRPVRLHVVHTDDAGETPAARARAVRDERQAEAERAIEEDPFVQAMKRDFGATVVPESVRPHTPQTPLEPNP